MDPSATPDPPGSAGGDAAALLSGAESGERPNTAALFDALYSELHRLAQSQLHRSPIPMTLGTTTLLHEAYLDMAHRSGAAFPDRGRFMGYAARVMRGLIIDYARSRQAVKRGSEFELIPLGEDVADSSVDSDELARIGQAIDELSVEDAGLARVVDLKFFCGFSFAEIAALRAVSERTVQRHWEKARIYLHRWMKDA